MLVLERPRVELPHISEPIINRYYFTSDAGEFYLNEWPHFCC